MRLVGFKSCLVFTIMQISIAATGNGAANSRQPEDPTALFHLSTGAQAHDGTSISVHQGVVEVITPQANTTVAAGTGSYSASGESTELPAVVTGWRAPERVSDEDWLSWTAAVDTTDYEVRIFSDQNDWLGQHIVKQPYLQLELPAGIYQLQLQAIDRHGLRSAARNQSIKIVETDRHTAPPPATVIHVDGYPFRDSPYRDQRRTGCLD